MDVQKFNAHLITINPNVELLTQNWCCQCKHTTRFMMNFSETLQSI